MHDINYVTIVLLYPGQRVNKVFRNRLKCWRWIETIYETVHEILPDPGHDTGHRVIVRVKNYDMFTRRLRDDDRNRVLHLAGVMRNTKTEYLITIKLFPLT
jgi:hypothetical protein